MTTLMGPTHVFTGTFFKTGINKKVSMLVHMAFECWVMLVNEAVEIMNDLVGFYYYCPLEVYWIYYKKQILAKVYSCFQIALFLGN